MPRSFVVPRALLAMGLSVAASVVGAQGDTLTVARVAPAPAVSFTRADLQRLSTDTVRWAPHGRPARVYRAVASTPGDSTPPGELLGDFVDGYGNTFSVSPSRFFQRPGNVYHIDEWHPGAQFFVARNDSANVSDGGRWTRVDWVMLPGMEPYRWGFCLTAYRARTREAARETTPADRASPRTGCNGFPFSRMRPVSGDG